MIFSQYQSDDRDDDYNKWYENQRYMDAYKTTRTLRGVDIEGVMMEFNIENLTAMQECYCDVVIQNLLELFQTGTMWLLPRVQPLRVLRMSHCLTCFTFP